MNPLTLTDAEINAWTPRTQAIGRLADAHFDTFNEMERARTKRERSARFKALTTLWHAAEHLRQETT